MLSRKILMHNFLEPFICVVDNFFQKILNFMRSILIISKSKIDQRSSTLVNTYVCKYIYRCLERESSKFPRLGLSNKNIATFWGRYSQTVSGYKFVQRWWWSLVRAYRQSIHNCQISDGSMQFSIPFCQGKRPFSDYISRLTFSFLFFHPLTFES